MITGKQILVGTVAVVAGLEVLRRLQGRAPAAAPRGMTEAERRRRIAVRHAVTQALRDRGSAGPTFRRGTGERGNRAGLRGLGASPAAHAHVAGQALLLAEKHADGVHEETAKGQCDRAFSHLLRARDALSQAKAHAKSGLRRAIHEVTDTEPLVSQAAGLFRRNCVRT